MNGERAQVNGQHLLNGATSTQHHQATEAKISRIPQSGFHGKSSSAGRDEPQTNGIFHHVPAPSQTAALPGSEQAPLEVLHLIGREHYLPMSGMISRTAQNCWNDLSALIDYLSTISVPQQTVDPSRPQSSTSTIANNQSKSNLDKKDRILNFAENQKAVFIKLLVLLQWSKSGEDVSKTVNLNFWLQNRRWVYIHARDELAMLKRDAPNFQIPNPDLKTAGEILSLGRATSFPEIGYQVIKPMKRRQILSVLRKLSRTVSVRLALEDNLPTQLQTYYIHDGRATFVVKDEFELDLSVLEESSTAPFRVVDFRFTYSPRPTIPDDKRQEIEFISNSVIDREGLLGCYNFFHSLSLTTKLTEYYNQALELSRNQWAGYLRVELLRRDLVVEYWRGKELKKSWVEISIRSGRNSEQEYGSPLEPYLAVRCFREGKEIKDFDLEMDVAELSFESILLQIVAQHNNHILDSVYDRLTSAELFKEDGLLVEQSSSSFEPRDCVMEMQMVKNVKVSLTVNPVTGSVMVSPASDSANRLQSDLNRSKDKGEDLVPRLLSYRCALAEAVVLGGIKNTCWERLDAFKPVLNEIRALFGALVTRVNFFRHPQWSSKYLLAITNNVNGDRLWILHQSAQSKAASLQGFLVLLDQPVRMQHDLSSSFFDSFADYASGIVVLHSNATKLQTISPRYRLPRIPEFDEDYVLPALLFEIEGGKVSTSDLDGGDNSMGTSSAKHVSEFTTSVKVLCQRVEAISKIATLSVVVRCRMEATVLERLATSNFDTSITFAPTQGRVSLEISIMVGESAIDEIVQKVTRLNDVLACIRILQRHSSTTLLTVSMTALTFSYKFAQATESRMVVWFPSTTESARLEFVPPGTDIHECLVPKMSQLLADTRQTFSTSLSRALHSLNLTHALIMTLHELQHPKTKGDGTSDATNVRLHVLVRQPTMFGLQFFSSISRDLVENPISARHERLVARFEILPSMKHQGQFLLRPAIEEPTSLGREVFARKGSCPDWIRLDSAAVFLKERPQPLLHALHDLIVDWVKSNPGTVEMLPVVEQPPVKKEKPPPPPPKPPTPNANVNSRKMSGQPSKAQPTAKPNSSNQPKVKNAVNKGPQQPPKNKEVITLD